jgi:hypothetical protein
MINLVPPEIPAAVPEVPVVSETPKSPVGPRYDVAEWSMLYLLSVLLLFGLANGMATPVALLGIVSAITLFWLVGIVVYRTFPGIATDLWCWTLFFALSQIFPFLQILAGVAAVNLWRWTTHAGEERGVSSFFDGFLVMAFAESLFSLLVAIGIVVRVFVGRMISAEEREHYGELPEPKPPTPSGSPGPDLRPSPNLFPTFPFW